MSLCLSVVLCLRVRVKVPAPPLHCLRVTFLACQRPQSSLCDPPDSLWPWHNLLPGRWPGQVPGNPPVANYATLCNTVSTQYNIALSEKRSPKPPSLRGHQLDQSKEGRLDILGADINPSLLIHFHLLVKSGTLCLKKCGFTIYVQTPLSLPEGPSVLEGELGYFEGRQPSPTLPSSTFTRTHCLLFSCAGLLSVHIFLRYIFTELFIQRYILNSFPLSSHANTNANANAGNTACQITFMIVIPHFQFF